jgi:hypothetical protein
MGCLLGSVVEEASDLDVDVMQGEGFWVGPALVIGGDGPSRNAGDSGGGP